MWLVFVPVLQDREAAMSKAIVEILSATADVLRNKAEMSNAKHTAEIQDREVSEVFDSAAPLRPCPSQP